MKIRMTKTINGSPDGISIVNYKDGQEYDLDGALLGAFLQMGVAEQVEINKPKEKAVLKSVPETKETPKKKGK
jgi:hypothetical protein